MKERIKKLRKTLGLTQINFGKCLGIAGNTVTSYERGIREPSNAIITSICREFGINERWLRTGEGAMLVELSRIDEALHIVKRACESGDDFIIDTFITLGHLSPAEWDLLRGFVDKLKNDKKSG